MTYQSRWRRACAGAKLGLGAAVVAGVMVFSAPAQAVTLIFGGSSTGDMLLAPANTNPLTIGEEWTVTLFTSEGQGTKYVSFTSTEPLHTVQTTVMNPQGDGKLPGFNNAQVGWFEDPNDFSTGTFYTIPPVGDVFLTTTFAAASVTMHLVFKWWGGINPNPDSNFASLNTNYSAIPLSAGLILFLSGLVGIGFLGRHKAKRRREEPAVA